MNFREILEHFYKKDKILTQNFVEIEKNIFEATFIFPPYDRTPETVGEKMGHVSMVQMNAALLEALGCAVGLLLQKGYPFPFSLQEFLDEAAFALFRRQNIIYRKQVEVGESAKLRIEIAKVIDVKKFYKIITKVDGFIKGEVECLWVSKGNR